MPEIIQYFVKGEFRPPTTTYIVPTGEPPLHEGSTAHSTSYHAQPTSHSHGASESQQQHHSEQTGSTYSFTHVGEKHAEAGEEQVSGAPSGAPPAIHEEKEQKPEPPPMEPSWDAQRSVDCRV